MQYTLRQKQSFFATLVAELIQHANELGYEVTFGEAYRSPEEAKRLAELGKGIVNSNHCVRLAIDLNLFRDGIYLDKSEDHRPLGEWWESLHPLCRWGGRFTRTLSTGEIVPAPDGNHYSLEHEGHK